MKFIKIFFGTIWKTYFLICLFITLFILYPFYFILLRKEKYFTKGFKLIRFHSLILLMLTGIFYKIKNKKEIKAGKKYIFIANHASYLDILLFYRLSPIYFQFFAKRELSNIPLFNIFFKRFNILIDRKSVQDAYRAYQKASVELSKGASLVLFPEGGIPREAPQMRKFKQGAFKLAIEEKVDIIPVTFINNWKLMEDKGYFKGSSRPGLSRVVVHKAISTKELNKDDLVSLQDKCYKTIYNCLKSAGQL